MKYVRVLLDQILTNDIIGSCALAKILDVILDSEMSFREGEIPRRQSLVTCAYRKYLQLKYTVSMSEKISICLNRGRKELVGNNDVSIVRARK